MWAGESESLNGDLIFGTMHIPGNASATHTSCQINGFNLPFECSDNPGSYPERATSIWWISHPAEPLLRQTHLLYGESELWAFSNGEWTLTPTGWDPMFGTSGFDNSYLNYSWVMEVVDNHLFVGTMDQTTIYSTTGSYDNPQNPYGPNAGADLWRIDPTPSGPAPAVPETTKAFGDWPGVYNYRPYGWRTLIKSADGSNTLFAGMATSVNLGAVGEGAGFQLLELNHEAPPPPPTCTWDIQPEEPNFDFDVDALDLQEGLNQGLLPGQLSEFAQQFGTANCNE